MELKDLERVAGILMTAALILAAILLRNQQTWWLILPGIIFLAAATMMWRVKLAEGAARRLLKDDTSSLEELERRARS